MPRITRTALLLALLAAALLPSCGGGGGGGPGGDPPPGPQTVRIHGNLTGGSHALVLNDVTQVIAFYVGGGWDVAPVTNGVIDVGVEVGEPVGVVFAGATDDFLGYLTLPNGLESLPLSDVDGALTTIELGTLSSLGTVVTASTNPLPGQIGLSTAEQLALGSADDAFASVARNPDTDGNGVIDVLENRLFRLNIMIFVDGGAFGGGTTPTVTTPAPVNSWRLSFSAWDNGNEPASVTFTGPGGSMLTNTPSETTFTQPGGKRYESPALASPMLPPAGTYTIAYGLETLTFTIPDQSQVPNRIVVAVPTVTTAGGDVTKVDWTYQLGNGTGSGLTPLAVIGAGVAIQISGSGAPCGTPLPTEPDRMYNSGTVPPSLTTHTVSCSVPWADVTAIFMTYNDVYQNHVVVSFTRP